MMSRPKVAIYAEDLELYGFVQEAFPQVDVHVSITSDDFIKEGRDADILFSNRRYDRAMLVEAARDAKWLHVSGTGIDRLQPLTDFSPKTVLTSSSGANAEIMADYVICVLLMFAWDFRRLWKNQKARKWERYYAMRMEGKTLALLGLGNVGKAVARRAGVMGMRMVGIKRTPSPVPGVEYVCTLEQLHQVLAEADYVVLSLPLTDETRGIIGPPELNAMKSTALLVNVGRGALIQESHLVTALRERRIAGAALDVFETEPLPTDSDLWALENVILSPHVSGWGEGYRLRSARIFCTNLERYLTNQPLLHVIDRSKPY